MHRTLENDRVGNTRVSHRIPRFFILAGMQPGRRMRKQMASKLKLNPLVALVGTLRVNDPFAATGTTTLEFAAGMASHHQSTWKEAA